MTPSPNKAEEDASVGRRSFLRWVSGIGAAISGVMVGIPVVRSFVSPVFVKPTESGWIKVADDTAVLDVGVPVRVDFVKEQDDAWVESLALNAVWLYTGRWRDVQGVQRPLHPPRLRLLLRQGHARRSTARAIVASSTSRRAPCWAVHRPRPTR